MLKLPGEVREAADTSSLETVIHAAAPCPVPVKEQIIEWWGPILVEYYGATEANGFTFCDSHEWLAHRGTVGKAILGEVLILDDEGKPCPTGTPGTVWFRGANQLRVLQRPGEDGRVAGLDRPDQHGRRRRLPRRRRVPLPHRPQDLHDHLGRREHLSAGDREPSHHPTRRSWTRPS